MIGNGSLTNVSLDFLLNMKTHEIIKPKAKKHSSKDRSNWADLFFLLHSMMLLFGHGYVVFDSLLKKILPYTNLVPCLILNLMLKVWLLPKTIEMIRQLGKLPLFLASIFINCSRNGFKNLPYFGIMVDEMMDNSVNQQLILYIKFLELNSDSRELETIIEYLDLISPKSSGAEDLTVHENSLH